MPVIATGLVAPLITRGMGANPRLLTRGMGGAVTTTIAVIRSTIKGSRRVYQDIYDQYKITACLLEVNGKELVKPIVNTIEKFYDNKEIDVQAKPLNLIFKKNKLIEVLISRFRIRRKNKWNQLI